VIGPPADAILPSTQDTHRGRLFRKYLSLILSLVTIVLLASSGINLYFSYRETRAALSDLQHEKAVGAASRIEQYVRQVSQQLAYAALQQLDADDAETRRVEFLKLLRQAPEVTDIAQLDANGREQVAVSRLGMDVLASNKDRSAEPAFQHAQRNRPWYGPVHFRKETEPYMTVAIRSTAGQGPATVGEMNLKFMWEVVSRIKIGERGKAYVTDNDGFLVADTDIGLVLRKTSLAELPHVKAALGADDGVSMTSRDLAGTPVLVSMAPIELLKWRVFVEQPIAEVYAKLNASVARTGALLLAGLMISALAAWALARGMVRPIRTLDEGARRIGAGELNPQIVVRTGDELEGLAEQFNRMSAQLRESYAGLERKVAQRTTELSEALEYQTAASDVLRAVTASPSDAAPVFETILDCSTRVFGSPMASVFSFDGEQVHFVAGRNWSPEALAIMRARFPAPPDTRLMSGRVILAARPFATSDALADDTFDHAVVRAGGWRRMIGAPLLKEGEPRGALIVAWPDPGPTPRRQTELLVTFADQAVIAIENVRLFHEIEDKSLQLEVANRHKSEFLANMSHELRTPLNAIIGFSEVLTEQMFGEVNAKQMEYLHDIHSSGHHLLALINDVLDMSKIEAGRMELDLSCFDLGLLLDNSMTMVRERAQRSGLGLTLEVGEGLEEWVADARKVKQAVVNLLSNAVKFTPAGGSVTLRARRADAEGRARAELSVADTGVGITPEEQALVFEDFRQASGDYLHKTEGTGLGLSLARRFIELHGGTLGVDSRPGEGATFTILLPQLELEAI
jgi:signal transduction histidine kinase